MSKVFVDADACPVIAETVKISKGAGLSVTLVCDTNHSMEKYAADEILTASQGADSADLVIANTVQKGDIVITQDYGLAALCIAKGCCALDQNGMRYTNENIDALLFSRFMGGKTRRAGGRTKGPPKRTAEQDEAFKRTLRQIIENYITT